LSDITSLDSSLVARVLEGEGRSSPEIRRGAFDNEGLTEPMRTFVEKVAHRARTVTDADISTLRKAGLSEDQIYEVVVCAAIGQATRQATMTSGFMSVARVASAEYVARLGVHETLCRSGRRCEWSTAILQPRAQYKRP